MCKQTCFNSLIQHHSHATQPLVLCTCGSVTAAYWRVSSQHDTMALESLITHHSFTSFVNSAASSAPHLYLCGCCLLACAIQPCITASTISRYISSTNSSTTLSTNSSSTTSTTSSITTHTPHSLTRTPARGTHPPRVPPHFQLPCSESPQCCMPHHIASPPALSHTTSRHAPTSTGAFLRPTAATTTLSLPHTKPVPTTTGACLWPTSHHKPNAHRPRFNNH